MSLLYQIAVLAAYLTQRVLFLQTSSLNDPEYGLNTFQMIENQGYQCESHIITTEDGYFLTYYRIPHKNPKKTVLLMHGLLTSSAEFVTMGPNRSLAYILADRGYDVWLANARGNDYSRKHVKYDVVKNAKEFFNFSWHEIGYYDIPAAVDYILNITGESSLLYIGHSQGSTSFLVLASTRPEYNSKFKLAVLLTPAAFMENISNRIVLGLVEIMDQLIALSEMYHIYELSTEFRKLAAVLCSVNLFYPTCQAILSALSLNDPKQLDQNKIAVYFTSMLSNAALKQLVHYGQLIKNGEFSQFDHGREKNLIIYKTEKPPSYNLSKITTSIAIYYGSNDGYATLKDVKHLISKLPNVVKDYLVSNNFINHADFTVGKDVYQLVYEDLIQLLNKF